MQGKACRVRIDSYIWVTLLLTFCGKRLATFPHRSNKSRLQRTYRGLLALKKYQLPTILDDNKTLGHCHCLWKEWMKWEEQCWDVPHVICHVQ